MLIKCCVIGSIALDVFYLIDIHYMVPYGAIKNVLSCIVARIRGYVYKKMQSNNA